MFSLGVILLFTEVAQMFWAIFLRGNSYGLLFGLHFGQFFSHPHLVTLAEWQQVWREIRFR
jgi:hypothetical protein